jgi:hypothetical protein
MAQGEHQIEPGGPVEWRKHRKLARGWSEDLAYLPRGRCQWNMTLAAQAYSLLRRRVARPDLNLWATMHACPPSARYVELGPSALVLWHGTSAVRAEKILQVGLYPKKGVWATAEPMLAHSFARGRSTRFSAGSAVIVLLLDKEDIPVEFEVASEPDTLRFRSHLGPEYIEYVLWDDGIDFAGLKKATRPRPWGVGRFKKAEGKWVPRSRPPVRFDAAQSYETCQQWLELSIRRILTALGSASALEVFSSLYATIDPADALSHEMILEALEGLCPRPRRRSGDIRHFSLGG